MGCLEIVRVQREFQREQVMSSKRSFQQCPFVEMGALESCEMNLELAGSCKFLFPQAGAVPKLRREQHVLSTREQFMHWAG